MHEASLVEGMMKIALHAAQEYQLAHPDTPVPRIREIICEAGLLSCFEEETLRACFEIYAEGTSAEQAKLVINRQPLECCCNDCNHSFQLERRHFVCPECASSNIKFSGGSGFLLQAINIDCGEDLND